MKKRNCGEIAVKNGEIAVKEKNGISVKEIYFENRWYEIKYQAKRNNWPHININRTKLGIDKILKQQVKSSSESFKNKKKSVKKNIALPTLLTADIELPFKSEKFKQVWNNYLLHRKQLKGAAFTEPGLKSCFTQILKESKGNERAAIWLIENAISNNWIGLFYKPVPKHFFMQHSFSQNNLNNNLTTQQQSKSIAKALPSADEFKNDQIKWLNDGYIDYLAGKLSMLSVYPFGCGLLAELFPGLINASLDIAYIQDAIVQVKLQYEKEKNNAGNTILSNQIQEKINRLNEQDVVVLNIAKKIAIVKCYEILKNNSILKIELK